MEPLAHTSHTRFIEYVYISHLLEGNGIRLGLSCFASLCLQISFSRTLILFNVTTTGFGPLRLQNETIPNVVRCLNFRSYQLETKTGKSGQRVLAKVQTNRVSGSVKTPAGNYRLRHQCQSSVVKAASNRASLPGAPIIWWTKARA